MTRAGVCAVAIDSRSTMAEVISLRVARKRANREKDAARAQQNRLLHGRSKAEKARERAQSEPARRELDAHRIEPEDGQ